MAKTSLWLKLIQYLRPHTPALVLGTIALLLTNILGVYIPWRVKEIVDGLAGKLDLSMLFWDCAVLLLLTSMMMVVRIASRQWIFGVGRQVEVNLKRQIFAHLLRMAPSYFNANPAGDLISRSTNDVDNIRRLMGFSILSLVNTFFAYAMTLPLMIALDWHLTLGAMAVYPLMLGVVLVFSNRLREEQLAVQERLGEISNLIQEDLNGIALIKVYAQETNEYRAFEKRNHALRDDNIRLALSRNLLFPLFGGLAALSLIVLLALGGPRLADGSLSIGAFTALTVYVERLVFPTALLGFTLTSFQRGQASLERVEGILGTEPTIDDPSDPQAMGTSQGLVRAENLTFTYPGRAEPALNNLSFTLKPGEIVAVVGAVGSGKSTLANALCRLLEIPSGQLFLDDRDITQLRLTDLRLQMAYVPQESFLFGATVAENIRYGRPDLPLEDVIATAKLARVHDEILTFPQGYETLVGERGITLSGGQRQRVALARALLMAGSVLILDDALASVDNETAESILNNLSTQGQKTVLLVTHRLSAAARADRILVLDAGHIQESGTHEQLLSQGGSYAALWTRYQMEAVLAT